MRSALLEHLYSGFDKDPNAAVALVLSHPQGVAWQVGNRRLIVSTESGDPLADLSLADQTLEQVALALNLAGVAVSYRNPDFAALLADVLIESDGRQSKSNGDKLYGHQSVLWAFMGAYAAEVNAAASRVPLAIDQAQLHSADGDWLDYWGGYFKVARRAGQTDANYLAWIVAETLRRKSNKYALENAVRETTGDVVEIKEPWQRIFRLDKSSLSGTHCFIDGVNAGYHLIQPLIPSGADWNAVTDLINKNKAAGIVISNPMLVFPTWHVIRSGTGIWFSGLTDYTYYVKRLLGELRLDGLRTQRNHPVVMFSGASLSNSIGANSVHHITPYRSVAKASMDLSGGYALGHETAVLGRGQLTRFVSSSTLSGALALSDQTVTETLDRAVLITIDSHRYGLLLGVVGSMSSLVDRVTSIYARMHLDTGWSGGWDTRPWNLHCISGMAMTSVAA